MIVLKVVPKTRTQKGDVFDYTVKPEHLSMMKKGLLVEIPFHGRKLEGIVIDFKRFSKIENLKSIINVIDPIPVVDEMHIKLAQWMSDYYLVPLGKTLFENIVPPAKRSIKQLDNDFKVL